MPLSDDDEDSGNDANGDSEGQFVPVSDDDEDSGHDANGDSEGPKKKKPLNWLKNWNIKERKNN